MDAPGPRGPGHPRDPLVRLFTELERRLKDNDWSGSLAANAAAALPADRPVNAVIAEHRGHDAAPVADVRPPLRRAVR